MKKNLILEQLVHDVNIAEQKFQSAEGKSINLAIYELMCAEERLNIYLIKKKKNSKERCSNGSNNSFNK